MDLLGKYSVQSVLVRKALAKGARFRHRQNKANIRQVGPGLGALLAVGFYKFIKALEYETVNVEKDPMGDSSKHYDLESKQERVITKGGHVVEVVVESRDSGSDVRE